MTIRIRRSAALVLIACAVHLGGCDYFTSAEQRIDRAQQRMDAADDRGAVIDLQNALRSQPGNVRARLMLADISLRLGDPKAARKELEQAISHGAIPAQVAELSAKVRLALGEFKELIAQLDSDKTTLPEPARSTYHGLALLGTRHFDDAATDFRRAIAADPSATQARVALAEVLAQQKQLPAALDELATVLAAEPKNPAASFMRGRILVEQGDYKGAVAAFAAARSNAAGTLSVSEYNRLLVALIDAQLASADTQGATASHTELLQRAPDASLTRLLTARLALIKQDYGTAVVEAQKVVTATPNLVPARLLLGSALAAQGNLNQAEVQFAEAVRAAPDNVEARKLLARVNLQLQRPDLALQILAPTQHGDASDPQLDALMGWASLQRGDESAGIALLERSTQGQPDNYQLKLNLAAAYMRGGQNDKAVVLLTAMPRTEGETQRDRLLITALAALKGPLAAHEEMERIVAASPKDAAVLNLAAEFYGRQRDFDRARKLLTAALATQPASAVTLINLARLDIATGNTAAAMGSIKKALAANPDDATARLAVAEVMLRSGDVAGAVPLLEQVRAGDTNMVEPRLLLARIYLQRGQGREADAVLGEVLKRGEGIPAIANVVGQLYLDAGRFDEALNQFNEATRQKPDDVGYTLNVARAQEALGRDANARKTLERVVADHPESIPANAALIKRDLRDSRYDVAAARVMQLKKEHASDPAVITLQGDVAMSGKSYAAAAGAYEAAAALMPSSALALKSYRARLLGKLADPLAPLEAWLEKRPKDVAASMVLAQAYVSAGQPAAAIKQYERTIQGERPNAMALNNLAWLYHEAGDARALETAKRAYTAAAGAAAIADTYGWILVQSGRVEDGLPILEKAVADSKSQPDIRYHYAAALAKSGKRDLALRELQVLSRVEQTYPSAQEARKLLNDLGG